MLLNIQALRALAAFLVVFVHLQTLAGRAGLAPGATEFGNAGVDLFFVISGMIMVFTTSRGDTTAGRFLLHRIVRIVPFYWLVTFAVFAVALAAPSLVQATRADPVQLLKSLLFIPFVKANGLTQPVVFVGWSLNYEMAFYLVFAAGMLTRRRLIGLAICCAALFAAVLYGALAHPANAVSAFYSSAIMLEFAFGIAIGGLMPLARLRPWMAAPALLAGGVALAVMLSGPWLWPRVDRLFMFGCPAAVIVASALVLERLGMSLRAPLIRSLGDASYAIYLTHFFVTQALIRAALAAHVEGAAPLAAVAAFTLVLVGAAGLVAHRWIEQPVTRLARGLTRPRPVPVVAAG